MAYPDLYSDETIVQRAQNIKVKSVSFEAVLTTRRLILVDSKKHLIAPQEILLATIREIEQGENAIRDPTITLSIITPTGATRQMILTFTKASGGERKRESDEWAKVLRQVMEAGVRHPIMPDPQYPAEVYPEPGEMYPPAANVEATNVPPMPAQKRKVEVARPGPIKKIVDTAPPIPKPVETSSLPTGSFCNKCGSRVPPGSAFCNKCGTPVVTDADLDARLAAMNEPPAPTVPQVQVHTPPSYNIPADKKERPIEEVIHSIEPLIEDSVPRTAPAPIVPNSHAPAAPAPEVPPEAPAANAAPGTAEGPAMPGVSWPVITPPAGTEVPVPAETAPAAAVPPAPQQPPVPPVPPVPSAPARSRKPLIIGAIIALVLIIIAAVVLLPALSGGSDTTAPVTEEITPAPTTAATTHATTATPARTTVATTTAPEAAATVTAATTTTAGSSSSLVPANGVWVRIVYANTFKGSVGTPGDQIEVFDTGEKVYQIPTSTGIVAVSVQKQDGSSEKLLVEVYKNGELVTQKSTTVPKGTLELSADLKTPTPTPTPTKVPIPVKTTAAANATAVNASVTTASS